MLFEYEGEQFLDFQELCPDLVASKATKLSELEVRRGPCTGKVLFIDNIVQNTERDQRRWHEGGLWPLCTHMNRVFVLGAGPGGYLPDIRALNAQAIGVDLDTEAIEFYSEHMPEWSNGQHWDDFITADVFKPDFLRRLAHYNLGKDDLVVFDLTDGEENPDELPQSLTLFKNIMDMAPDVNYVQWVGITDIRYEVRMKKRMQNLMPLCATHGTNHTFWYVSTMTTEAPMMFHACGPHVQTACQGRYFNQQNYHLS